MLHITFTRILGTWLLILSYEINSFVSVPFIHSRSLTSLLSSVSCSIEIEVEYLLNLLIESRLRRHFNGHELLNRCSSFRWWLFKSRTNHIKPQWHSEQLIIETTEWKYWQKLTEFMSNSVKHILFCLVVTPPNCDVNFWLLNSFCMTFAWYYWIMQFIVWLTNSPINPIRSMFLTRNHFFVRRMCGMQIKNSFTSAIRFNSKLG